jgi:hypothetical protein
MPDEASEPVSKQPAAPRDEEAFDADGRFRPRFVLSFPDDPDLRALVVLFEKGDFKTLNERAPELARRTQDRDVRAACEELMRRTRPDPTIKLMLLLAIGFFFFLVVWTYW